MWITSTNPPDTKDKLCDIIIEMTQSEFIKSYCEKSKITEEKANELGLFAVPCDCQQTEDCKGWAMITRENLKSQIELYIK